MIITVTLNPAIDKTVTIDDFKINSVNKVSSIRLDAGGKGINVSKVIKTLGGESKALGILAGSNGQFIKNYLDAAEIKNDFIFVEGETRTNLKVVDKVRNTNTDINEAGIPVSKEAVNKLEDKIFKGLDENSIVVFSGSAPSSMPIDIYKTLVMKAKSCGAKTVLDADGELLKEGIKSGPYLIKPNIHELEALFNEKLENTEDVIKVCKRFFDYGIEVIVVSLGGEGALFITKDKAIKAEGLKVEVKSTVGAGDSMVAALAFSLEKGYSLEEAVELSVAASAANVTTSGTEPASFDIVLQLKKKVNYKMV